jgi:hypothetical protein
MFIDNAEAKRQMNNINNGLTWMGETANNLIRWARATEQFTFGHQEVQMTNAIIDTQVAVILAHEPIRSNEDLKTIPHVRLVFDNEAGIDSLIRALESARRDLKDGINTKETT